MVRIRVAKVQDAAAIARVHVQSGLTTYRGIVPADYPASLSEAAHPLLWQGRLTRNISVFVAEIEGDMVGFARAGAIREPLDAYRAELYTLICSRRCRDSALAWLSYVPSSTISFRKALKACLSGCSKQNRPSASTRRPVPRPLTANRSRLETFCCPKLLLAGPICRTPGRSGSAINPRERLFGPSEEPSRERLTLPPTNPSTIRNDCPTRVRSVTSLPPRILPVPLGADSVQMLHESL